jgi:hypothetical protein
VNLRIFLQVADGVDEATWRHHLEKATWPTGSGT